jgi:hypothetical protein
VNWAVVVFDPIEANRVRRGSGSEGVGDGLQVLRMALSATVDVISAYIQLLEVINLPIRFSGTVDPHLAGDRLLRLI